MSQHTTPAVARSTSAPTVFAPGGCTWVPVPVGLDGPALHAWMALMRCRRGTTVTAPDRVLAGLAGRSARTIQEGLRLLEADELIERTRRHGARVIVIVGRLAGRPEETVVKRSSNGAHRSSTDSQPAAEPYRSPPAAPIRRPARPPSYGGVTAQEQAGPPIDRPAIGGPVESPEPPCPAFRRFFAAVCPAPA